MHSRPRGFTEPLERRTLLSAAITPLINFDSTTGSSVGDLTLGPNGNFFGTTNEGNGTGDVFQTVPGSNTLSVIATTNGVPFGTVAFDSAGNLYGTTENGGANAQGSVFEIAAGSSAVTTLASFSGPVTGKFPSSGVIVDPGGNLFGTAAAGGANGYGAVFELAAGTNAITTLASFNATDGSVPSGALALDPGGNLFGVTESGGTGGDGSVFEVAHGTNAITSLASFNVINGQSPLSGVILDSGGTLYGTTPQGGTVNDGVVFKIAPGSNTITTLANFNGANGSDSSGGLTIDSSGNLYGTTATGGANNDGTVFEIPNGTNAVTTLASFAGTDGSFANRAVRFDSSGNLYSTTQNGGANSDGTLFQIASVIPAAPDLQLANVQYGPTNYFPGDGILLTGTQENAGGAAAGAFQIEAFLSTDRTFGDANDIPLGTASESGLAAGASQPFSIQGTIPSNVAPGNYYVLAKIDSGNSVFEINENNNVFVSASANVSVSPSSPVITQTSGLQASLTGRLPTSPVVAGQKLRPIVQTVRMTNPAGNGTVSGSFTIQLLLSGTTFANVSDPAAASVTRKLTLRAGRSVSVPIVIRTLPASVSGSKYLVAVVTDPGGSVALAASSSALSVQAPFVDLSGSFTRVPRAGKAGRPVLVAFAVNEAGNVPVIDNLPVELLASPDGTLANATTLGTVTRHVVIQPGHRQVVLLSAPSTNLAAGFYTLIARIDPQNTLSDADLTNNTVLTSTAITLA